MSGCSVRRHALPAAGWGHDGVAVGECITASIGFRAPLARELAADVVERLADAARDDPDAPDDGRRYRDAGAAVSDRPARIPESLQAFAATAIDGCSPIASPRRARSASS
jgi:50S ribosomal protein L16 3-hydroxylase